MNNEELFDAIAFTWQSAENANKGYATANNDRANVMLEHLKKLLSIQLDRAKVNYDNIINIDTHMKFDAEPTILQPRPLR